MPTIGTAASCQQENDALFSYAADLDPAGAVVARYVADIFKGTAPGELPV